MRRTALFVLTLTANGFGWDFTYSATLTGQPTWTRPLQDFSGLSLIGVAVPYQVQSFIAPATGTYTFLSTATSPANWDNFLVLYRNSFNPLQPLVNAIAANDDLNNNVANIGRSGFNVNLTLGTNYFLVTTAFSTLGSVGSFSNTFSTNATVNAPVPEPSTWLMIAFGLATLWFRRQVALKPAPARIQPPRA